MPQYYASVSWTKIFSAWPPCYWQVTLHDTWSVLRLSIPPKLLAGFVMHRSNIYIAIYSTSWIKKLPTCVRQIFPITILNCWSFNRILRTTIRSLKSGWWTLSIALPTFSAWPSRIALDWNQYLKWVRWHHANVVLCLVEDFIFFPSRQLLTIIGPFLERKQIGQIFSHNFFLLQQQFREELETCKNLFRKQLTQVWKETFNMSCKYSERNTYHARFLFLFLCRWKVGCAKIWLPRLELWSGQECSESASKHRGKGSGCCWTSPCTNFMVLRKLIKGLMLKDKWQV